MENLDEFENKAVNLDDPDGLERKSAHEHEARKRKQFDDTAILSGAGGDVAKTQRHAVASGATRVVGNVHDNSN